jgi:hypothetical protein
MALDAGLEDENYILFDNTRPLPASTITECKVLLRSLIEVKPSKVTKTMIVAYTLLSVLSNQSNIRWLDRAGAPA